MEWNLSILPVWQLELKEQYVPAKNTQHKIKNEERSDDDQRDEIDPWPKIANCIIHLILQWLLIDVNEFFY